MCTSSVSNVIYHKFTHGAAFYKRNGKNVNVMLEFHISNAEMLYELRSSLMSSFELQIALCILL